MAILISGATGLLGSALTAELTARGQRVIPLRREAGAAGAAGAVAAGEAVWDPAADRIDLSQAGPLEAVMHLAGETIGQRWTAARKRRMWDSRCRGTRLLCDALAGLRQPPRTLLCASATGYYGDRGAEWLEENSPAGHGFLADLTRAWEEAAAPAAARGMRVVHLRFSVVLSARGGALARMLPIFRWGAGGRLGDGRQYWSWIDLEDAVRGAMHALETETLRGAVNITSPGPVTNREFTVALGRMLGRPTFCAVPRVAVQLAMGEMGREALLASFRVRPARLQASGFKWNHPELGEALAHCLRRKEPAS